LDHHVNRGELLVAAVGNNASWCDAVCRSHGFPGVFDTRLWVSHGHHLEFYPQVITLSPEVAAGEATATKDSAQPYAVKDSFARLDLAPDGLEVLFEAQWLLHTSAPATPPVGDLRWSRVNDAHQLRQWESAWAGDDDEPLFLPELLTDPRCTVLAAHRNGVLLAGIIAYTAEDVVGISNLFGTALPAPQQWASALQAVAALQPHLPIVGYEHGSELTAAKQAGAQPLGPLRIWTQ
jgi:hypothetical protein